MNFTFGQNTWYQITRVKGQNVHDQIAFGAFHSFLVEFQTNAGYIHVTMCNNNLEIRTMGSSSRLNNLVIAQNKTKYLNNQLYINTSESTVHRNEAIKKILIFSKPKWSKQGFSYKILKILRCSANL